MSEVRLGSRTLEPGRQLLADGERVALGKRALDILSVLAERPGKIVTKDELLDAVWPGVTVEENALQVHIVALRKALGPEADRLTTIRGVGYQLDVDPEQGPAARPSAQLTAPATPHRYRWAIAAAAVVVLLAGAWALFGSQLGLKPKERIPVLVRVLEPGGGNATEAALASGVTDELIHRLRRVPELRIATAEANGAAPGPAFSAAYTVDGTIRSTGNRVHVAVRLTDPDGEILLSRTLDRAVSDVFGLQEEIATAIAGALSVSLDVGVNSTQYGGTRNPDAYANFLQGYAFRWDPDRSRPTLYLERAVELDPNYARAWAELGNAYALTLYREDRPDQIEVLLRKMDHATAQALRISPDLWIGYAARSWYFMANGRLADADALHRRAVTLDRGDDPDQREYCANFMRQFGRVRAALDCNASKAVIDPYYETRVSPGQVIDTVLANQPAEALRLFRLAAAREFRFSDGDYVMAAWAHLLRGDTDAAKAVIARAGLQARFPDPAARTFDPETFPDLPRGQLRAWATQRYGAGGRAQLADAAVFAAFLRNERLALDYLTIAYERPGMGAYYLLWHPALRELRRSAGFRTLVGDLGLVAAWRKNGDWGDYCQPAAGSTIACQ